jgi:hypothetical protein
MMDGVYVRRNSLVFLDSGAPVLLLGTLASRVVNQIVIKIDQNLIKLSMRQTQANSK